MHYRCNCRFGCFSRCTSEGLVPPVHGERIRNFTSLRIGTSPKGGKDVAHWCFCFKVGRMSGARPAAAPWQRYQKQQRLPCDHLAFFGTDFVFSGRLFLATITILFLFFFGCFCVPKTYIFFGDQTFGNPTPPRCRFRRNTSPGIFDQITHSGEMQSLEGWTHVPFRCSLGGVKETYEFFFF